MRDISNFSMSVKQEFKNNERYAALSTTDYTDSYGLHGK